MTFNDLNLIPELLRGVNDVGYEQPTPIQRDTIPPALEGRDIIGCAQTGTGKTAAFALPVLQRLNERVSNKPLIRTLVLTPTRELAAQIDVSFATYGKHLKLWHMVIFGGVKDGAQKKELRRGIDILIATPGRLLDLIGQGEISLGAVEFFVLDEADRMLDMGFLPDVKRVTAMLPPKAQRQTLFFSATMPPQIRSLARDLLNDPVSVTEERLEEPVDLVTQQIYFVDKSNKRDLLREVLASTRGTRVLVFSRTKHGANRIAKVLDRSGIDVAAIHGNKSQGARTRALEGFRRGDVRVLVATDLAARGLDVSGITHVINFDLPNEPETYVHRIGRTARAGASGIAISFCADDERPYLADIERLIKQHIPRILDHGFPPSQVPPAPTRLDGQRRSQGKPSSGGRSGGHPRGKRRGPRRGGRRW
ncbi:MAG: DEAD/DEAH box helicase [Proteobacteria bacterium]|nr:DEAD/DEAH box helicase [Pseudomonadota bacterium]